MHHATEKTQPRESSPERQVRSEHSSPKMIVYSQELQRGQDLITSDNTYT